LSFSFGFYVDLDVYEESSVIFNMRAKAYKGILPQVFDIFDTCESLLFPVLITTVYNKNLHKQLEI